MKKLFTYSVMAMLALSITSNAQVNILQGSDMETEDAWMVSNLNSHADNAYDYEFGYADDIPDYGDGGALHFSVTNNGTDGAHAMFYQEVTLNPGDEYMVNMAVKTLAEMNNSWFEIYIGTEPVEGEDYGSGQTAIGGWKWDGWEEACSGLNEFDGTLQEIGCLENSNGTFTVEGDGPQTLYLAFKAGIWGVAHTIEFVVDNVELLNMSETPSAIKANTLANAKVYPNPVNNAFSIQSENEYKSVKIFNILGKEVLNIENTNQQIDASSLISGMYLLELKDENGKISSVKFQKQ